MHSVDVDRLLSSLMGPQLGNSCPTQSGCVFTSCSREALLSPANYLGNDEIFGNVSHFQILTNVTCQTYLAIIVRTHREASHVTATPVLCW